MTSISQSKLVMIVDDDEPIVRVMSLILEPEGYELSVAATRQKALELLGEQTPHVMVMDYRMPGPDPTSFIEQARRLGFHGPILLCTAMDENLGLPVDGVLRKPFEPDDLPRRLEELIG